MVRYEQHEEASDETGARNTNGVRRAPLVQTRTNACSWRGIKPGFRVGPLVFKDSRNLPVAAIAAIAAAAAHSRRFSIRLGKRTALATKHFRMSRAERDDICPREEINIDDAKIYRNMYSASIWIMRALSIPSKSLDPLELYNLCDSSRLECLAVGGPDDSRKTRLAPWRCIIFFCLVEWYR